MVLSPLPIDEVLPEVLAAVGSRGLVVLQAPPGAGKTTRVPPALAALLPGQILVLEPRRVAARAAARRIAEEQGWKLGREVGYQVRFERVAGPTTRVLVVTEGIALRLLEVDPFLTGVSALVFDEFHERNLASDLALALAAKVRREVRPDLALVVMSATLEAGPVAAFLDDAPVLTSLGRQYPVAIDFESRPDERPLSVRVAGAVQRAAREGAREGAGDVLAFLPGVGEIERCRELLAEWAARENLLVLPLYGELPPEQQDLALRPADRRRVVLATNVAETSVTLDGVAVVVDSGMARVLEYDAGSGLDRLVLTRISRASAEQRAGRAGRQAPGRALRLWTAAEQVSLAERTLPEIRRVDLAGAALALLAWGERDLATFPWFETPEPGRLEQALALLGRLGALEAQGLTTIGRRMATLPLHPRLARLLVEGERRACLPQAALAAALLSERSPFERDRTRKAVATRSDLLDQISALESSAAAGPRPGRAGAGPAIHRGGARRVLAVRNDLLRMMGQHGRNTADERPGRGPAASEEFLAALVTAYPDRLVRRREAGGRRGVMVGGRGVVLGEESGVTGELFLALDLDAGARGAQSEARVRLASVVEREWLEELGEGVLHRRVELAFDETRERVTAVERLLAWDLVLEERQVPVPAERAGEALGLAAAARLEELLPWSDEDFAGTVERLRCLAVWCPELELPEPSAALSQTLPSLAEGKRSFEELRRLPWLEILRGLLSASQLRALEREAPERLAVPSGSLIRLKYQAGEPPVLAARIQELFGLAETPRIASGRVPVLLHLLAPNGRPQQVTRDLASFWTNVYPQVRKELAGRYPKHSWPLDPWTAQPERRPRRKV